MCNPDEVESYSAFQKTNGSHSKKLKMRSLHLLGIMWPYFFIGALSLVIAVFYVAGWTLGAVEAISLSILVGTSVDYTVHLTENY